MMENLLTLFTFLLSAAYLSKAAGEGGPGLCYAPNAASCADCVQASPHCAWCADANFTEPSSRSERCMTQAKLKLANCTDIQFPKSSQTVEQDYDVKDGSGRGEQPVQVQPQRLRMDARVHEPVSFDLNFRAANNYPVDIYFLFDISNSMKTDLQNFAAVVSEISEAIKSQTDNYKLGYGIFQDKVVMPFTDVYPEKLKDACYGYDNLTCGPPLGFKHLVSMTDDNAAIEKKVKWSITNTTGNLDNPEGGLDALIQVIACKDRVGWRSEARRMVILATNDIFHIAGDGRLAGIVLPNDLQCHLDDDNAYTLGSRYDYPSVGQVSYLVEKNDIHTIFAISGTEEKDKIGLEQTYLQLTERILSPPSTLNKINNNDRRNILNVVVEKYKSIVSRVEMVHTQVDGVKVEIKGKDKSLCKKGNICHPIQIGDKIEFSVKITIEKCPPEDQPIELTIYPAGLQKDNVTVRLAALCGCDCLTNDDTWVEDADQCTQGNGTLKCGVCHCHAGRRGDACECDASAASDADFKECKCNGRARLGCDCGRCLCDAGYSGKNCECVDSKCGVFDEKVCGGPARGYCDCGACRCQAGYTGPDCGCATDTAACINPTDNSTCSNSGNCECGKCKCEDGYIGRHCQTCLLCGNDACHDPAYRECAVCVFSAKGDVNQCTQDCKSINNVTLVDQLSDQGTEGGVQCDTKLPDACVVYFQVVDDGGAVALEVLRSAVCPEPQDFGLLIGLIVGGVLLIGLLVLLVLRLLVWLWDRREFSRYEEERKNLKWGQEKNPIYKDATVTYRNPTLDADEI